MKYSRTSTSQLKSNQDGPARGFPIALVVTSMTIEYQHDLIMQLREENERLRARLANSGEPCVYCDLKVEDWSKCQGGFPGCARADDAVMCPHFAEALQVMADHSAKCAACIHADTSSIVRSLQANE